MKLKPKNIYGLTKKINEEIIDLYCSNVKTKFIGLRFFTVYGEWGRPDMLLIKFMIASLKKKIFKIHNYGNHVRDFTYIGDVVNARVEGIKKVKILGRLNKSIKVRFYLGIFNDSYSDCTDTFIS